MPFRPSSYNKYIVFYKPYGVVCQFGQSYNSEKTTLAQYEFPKNVYAVGRLDSDSEGLLILSDDKRMNHLLLDPSYSHKRIYLAQVENIPSNSDLEKFAHELNIDGNKLKPASAKLLSDAPTFPERIPPVRKRQSIPTSWIEITLSEGKNRQVRKMTAAIGYPTLRLIRVAIGELHLPNTQLEPGKWKYLTTDQVDLLFA